MNTAKYIEIRQKYIKAIQKGMQQYFWDNLFKELYAVFQDGAVYNTKSALSDAIKSGRVYYYQGAFRTRTKFSNAVASELEQMGAKFRYKAYYINEASIPLEIQNVLAIMQVKGAAQISAIERILTAFTAKTLIPLEDFIKSTVNMAFKQLETDILKEAIDKKVPVIELGLATPKAKGLEKAAKELDKWHNQREKEADKIRKQIEKEIEAHLTPKAKELRNQINEANKQQKVWKAQRLRAEYNKEVNANLTQKAKDLQEKLSQHNAETITQAPDLSVKIEDLSVNYKSAKIAEDYIYNMNFWVKKWQTKNIIKMRSDIMDLYQKGARIPEIQEYIERRWKVAKDKAAFLAENECGLVTTAVQAATWQESGAEEFIWCRSVSREKRPLHKTYYDEKFRFDNPPILDEKLDIRGLPRQIWNCKCGMKIVVPSIDKIMQAKKEQQNVYRKITNAINGRQRNNSAWRYRRFSEGQTV